MSDSESPARSPEPLLCSSCFADCGLTFDAYRLGFDHESPCPHYGKSDISVSESLQRDAALIGEAVRIGFFHYGPRLWMVGEVEPLKSLQRSDERDAVVERIIAEYPERVITPDEKLLRLRKRPTNPSAPEEYDSPPTGVRGAGRFESDDFQVLYASQDLEVCIHECRVTVEDELYLATLKPRNAIQCLDLTAVLKEDATEFESLASVDTQNRQLVDTSKPTIN
jgi:hypothetical protein